MKQTITLTVAVQEDDTPTGRTRVRRIASSLEQLVIEAMALTGRRGVAVTMDVAVEAEPEPAQA